MDKVTEINKRDLSLTEALFIGKGRSRKCYMHPEYKELCIKVATDHKRAKRSIRREIGYFKRLKRRGTSFAMISQYFHPVQTDEGAGEVYELVRDHDGNISKDLRYYLDLGDSDLTEKILNMIEALRAYLLKEYILFSDLDVENILLQKVSPTEERLVVIDGIGDNNQIPFLEYVPPLGIKRSIRKWEIFRRQLIEEFSCPEDRIKKFNE